LPESVFYAKWEELFDYSLNLSGHFRPEDNYIELTGEGRKEFYKYWDFQSEVAIPVYGQNFIFNPLKGCFFLPTELINEGKWSIPFTRPPKEIEEKIIPVILHTPTCCNFWHFSIRWKDNQGEYISVSDAKWKRKLLGAMRALLIQTLQAHPPATTPLEAIHYQTNTSL
jgi:hypothetical protein